MEWKYKKNVRENIIESHVSKISYRLNAKVAGHAAIQVRYEVLTCTKATPDLGQISSIEVATAMKLQS